MDKNIIVSALISSGIDEKNAFLLAEDLVNLKAPFDGFLKRWLANSSDKEDYELEGIKMSVLIEKSGLSYPAALSTMNWILDEGQTAVDYINSNI